MAKRYQAVRIEPRDDIFEALADQMRKTPSLMRIALKRQGTKFKSRILQRLRVEPPSPNYPLRWKTEKQRRAFFATDGFGRGIPTRRTGALARGWTVEIDDSELIALDVFNRQPYTTFVEGDDQQPFHMDTKWLYAPQIMSDEIERFEDVMIETYFTVGDPTAPFWR